jgi:Protein of unknown function (DUF669)
LAKAGWGNARQELPVGNYLAQVVECVTAKVKDLKNPGKQVEKFKFTVDVQVDGQWETRTVYTAMNFTDETQADDPQFISGLNKIVRACGLKVPETLEEAEEFDTDHLEGRQFVWSIQQDEETHKIVRKFLKLKRQALPQAEAAPAPVRPPVAQPAPPLRAVGPTAGGGAARAETAPSYAAATTARAAQPAAAPSRNSRPSASPQPAVDNDPFA